MLQKRFRAKCQPRHTYDHAPHLTSTHLARCYPPERSSFTRWNKIPTRSRSKTTQCLETGICKPTFERRCIHRLESDACEHELGTECLVQAQLRTPAVRPDGFLPFLSKTYTGYLLDRPYPLLRFGSDSMPATTILEQHLFSGKVKTATDSSESVSAGSPELPNPNAGARVKKIYSACPSRRGSAHLL
ncbi:hypothetical protein EDB86DRAFT_834245 [Lactarius hatsudake]|nr:hypothetical protein EDB86DRAFT_834245 [Lactarius hatsudake]